MNHRVLPVDLIVKSRQAKCTSLFQENVAATHEQQQQHHHHEQQQQQRKNRRRKKGELWLNYGR